MSRRNGQNYMMIPAMPSDRFLPGFIQNFIRRERLPGVRIMIMKAGYR